VQKVKCWPLCKHITHPHRHAGKIRKQNSAKTKAGKAQAAKDADRVEQIDAKAAKKAAKKQKRKREAKKKKKRKSKKKRKKQTEEGGAPCDDSSTTDSSSSSSSSDDGDEEQPAPAKKAKHATKGGPQSPAPATPKGPPSGTPATPSAPPGKRKTVPGAAARKKAPPAAAAALLDIPNFAPDTGLCMTNAAVGYQRMAGCVLMDDEPPGLERGWKLVTGIQRTGNGAKFTIPKDQILRTCNAKSRQGDKTDYTTIEDDDDR
jgi:hypothetical protein